MEVLKLIGIAVVVVGFALKLDALAVAVAAGIATGLAAGMSPMELLTALGDSFVRNRMVTLFVLMLPVIGMCERYGLRDKAADIVRSFKKAALGRSLALWQVIRSALSAMGLRLGGQPIQPAADMAMAGYAACYGEADEAAEDKIRSLAAGAGNFGNFFAQNCFMGSAGTLLVVSVLAEQGCEVSALEIAGQSVPVAVISVVVGIVYALIWDFIFKKRTAKKA